MVRLSLIPNLAHPHRLRRAARAVSAMLPLAVVVGAMIARPATAQGPAPTGWDQFQGDAAHTGLASGGPQPPYREVWEFRGGEEAGGGLSAPVIAEGLALAVGRDTVYAADLATGTEAWRIPREEGSPTPPAIADIDGTPVLVFSEGDDEDTAALRAVSLADRSDAWRSPLRLDAASRTGITVDGDLAFVGDSRGNVYAVDVATGTVSWRRETDGVISAPLTVGDGTVYGVVRDESRRLALVVALDAATGERAWSFTPASGTGVASGPVLGGDGVFVGFADRVLRGFDAGSGRQLWGARTNALFSPVGVAAYADGDVLATDLAGQVYRLDGASGGREWDHALNDLVIRSSPVVVGDVVLVGLNDGRLVALDLASGDLVWESEPTPGLVGALAVSPDVVIAVKGGEGGRLIAFEHDPNASLVRVPSPTRLQLGEQLLTALGSVVAVAALILVLGRLLARRMGPPDLEADTDVEDLAPQEGP